MNKEKIIRTPYIKQYTNKEWRKFSLEIQEFLCQKYNVFLVERIGENITPANQTLKEFLQQSKKDQTKQVLRNLNKRNLNRGIAMINQTTDNISKFTKSISFNKDLI